MVGKSGQCVLDQVRCRRSGGSMTKVLVWFSTGPTGAGHRRADAQPGRLRRIGGDFRQPPFPVPDREPRQRLQHGHVAQPRRSRTVGQHSAGARLRPGPSHPRNGASPGPSGPEDRASPAVPDPGQGAFPTRPEIRGHRRRYQRQRPPAQPHCRSLRRRATIHPEFSLPRAPYEDITTRSAPSLMKAHPNTACMAHAVRILTEYILPERNPTVAPIWSSEPDKSQHYPGVGPDFPTPPWARPTLSSAISCAGFPRPEGLNRPT